jgi:hypothetical protein
MEFHDGSTSTNNVDWFQVLDCLLGLRTRHNKFAWDKTHHKTSLKSKSSPRFRQGLGLGNVKVNQTQVYKSLGGINGLCMRFG